jgi:hypothetical protein
MALSRISRPLALFIVAMMVLPTVAFSGVASAEDGETRSNDGFRSFIEIEAQLVSLAENYSDIAVLYDLGDLYPNANGSTKTSHEGRHFWGLKISDNPRINESDEIDILYIGLHHAREWMTTEMMMWMIEHILADYGNNATITDIVDNRELWMFPVQNPDGFVYSETNERTWRKNRRDNGLPDVARNFGVDPNRNYGYEWGYDDIGSDPDPADDLYRGPYPFSEPCTQIVRDLALDINFDRAISFHTYTEVMGFPPAYKSIHVPHYPFFRELGRRMAVHNGYEYGDVADGTLYNVNGGFDDFMYYNVSCLSFTYEMNSDAQGGFYVDSSLIVPTCTMNYEAALEMAKAPDNLYEMFDAGIDGIVVDPRGVPLENVSVNVTLLADDALNITTGPDGRFSFHAPDKRFYDITVEKEGFSRMVDSYQAQWDDRLTEVTITIKDNVSPSIARVEARHEGVVGTEFGIGQEVRFDLYEASDEAGLEGVVTIQSVPAQYFHRRKPLTYDEATGTYFYLWNTDGLKPRNDYLVTTELWDIDDNRDKDGVTPEGPDLTLTLRDITPPMTPINLTVTELPEGRTLVLSWEANIDDTEAYTLERKVEPDGEWALLIELGKDELTFVNQGLENDVSYSFRLMAWDKVPLPSGWSVEITGTPHDSVPPGDVSGLSVTAPLIGGILELTWTESTDDAAVYVLYKDAGQGFEPLTILPRGVTEYTDLEVVNERTYHYRISALDASENEGSLSDPVIGLPRDQTPPSLPVVSPLPQLTNISEHLIEGTAEAGSKVVAMVNQEEVERYDVSSEGTFSGTITLDNGVNRISYKSIDAAMNPSGHTETFIVQVDLNAPRVTYSEPSVGQLDVPVDIEVAFVISESLVSDTVFGTLKNVDTGEIVPASIGYTGIIKSITVTPQTSLRMGAHYEVTVEGTDMAGNHLTGGILTFTTVKEEEPEPSVSGSFLMLLVIIGAIVVLMAVLALKFMGGKDPPLTQEQLKAPEEPSRSITFEGAPEYQEGYDPRSPGQGEPSDDQEWKEY